MSEHLSKEFWSQRYANETTGWDLGHVSTPLREYFDQLTNKHLRILIPGCGNAYEAEYLWKLGFQNVHVVDLSEHPLENLKARCPDFPSEQLHAGNFFEHKGMYDLIVEQTMFCAIDPSLRQAYADKAYELLSENGKLVGVMFDRHFEGGPPYGGDSAEYQTYFEKFTSCDMKPCHNSVEPRMGNELFVKILK